MPENYVRRRLNLLSALASSRPSAATRYEVLPARDRAVQRRGHGAEKQFGIRPERVKTPRRGARAPEDIYMGVAFTSGLDKVVVPFFDKGLPAEYELVRSIATVSQQKRKRSAC